METKSAVDNFANIWMVDYVIIIFSMVCYNNYEYLEYSWNIHSGTIKEDKLCHEGTSPFLLWFDTKSMNVCNLMYSLWSNKKILQFHTRLNFTTYFTFLCLIFIWVGPKNKSLPL